MTECREILYDNGYPIAVCTLEWGTEHSHADHTPAEAVAAGRARPMRHRFNHSNCDHNSADLCTVYDLSVESGTGGDYLMVAICQLALGEGPVWYCTYCGGMLSIHGGSESHVDGSVDRDHDPQVDAITDVVIQEWVSSGWWLRTQEDAMAECLRVLASARQMEGS